MWRLIFIYFTLGSQIALAQIRVTTWNLSWFPSGTPNKADSAIEALRIKDVATTLQKLNSDIILLEEVRDLAACQALVNALNLVHYNISVISNFGNEGSVTSHQQLAILSRMKACKTDEVPWHTFGIVDPPRGFVFARYELGTNSLDVYAVHLKSNLAKSNWDSQLNILKRELSVAQLMHRIETEISTNANHYTVIVGGDFNTNPDENAFISEKTLRTFQESGFTSGFEDKSLSQRVTHPRKGRYPDTTFDYIFLKGVTGENPEITFSPLSDHLPVTRIIHIQ